MEFTNTTELNDAISSDFIDFQDSLDYTAPSSDHYMDDEHSASYSQKYTEITRMPSGRCKVRRQRPVMVETGEPVERSDSDHFGFSGQKR